MCSATLMNTEKTVSEIKWAFFGSSHFSVLALNELESLGVVPKLIVTTPDKPKGRGLQVVAGEVRAWAEQRNIPVLAPASLKTGEIVDELTTQGPWDTFLIASYGKIVPAAVLEIPVHGTLNIHPSLLPKLRGPSPLETAILNESRTGVTIMKVDEQVDHGPILSKREVTTTEWPPYFTDLETLLATEGARLFAETLPNWVNGKIHTQEQDHDAATFTKKFEKEELQIDPIAVNEDAEKNPTAVEQTLRKIRAFSHNRGAYYFINQNSTQKRIIVTRANIENGKLVLVRVKPEGKNEMRYEDFLRGIR